MCSILDRLMSNFELILDFTRELIDTDFITMGGLIMWRLWVVILWCNTILLLVETHVWTCVGWSLVVRVLLYKLAHCMKLRLIAGFFMGTTQMPRYGGCWLAQAGGSVHTWRKAARMFFQPELCWCMGCRSSGASPLSICFWLFCHGLL